MEKVVLSRGYEFELIANGVNERGNDLIITFLPGEHTVEELMQMWKGNSNIKIQIDDTAIREFNNFTVCTSMTLTPNYHIKTLFRCPECAAEVEPGATNCWNCNAAFEQPAIDVVRGTVCTVKCSIPDINDRMADAEDSIEDIINTILG